MSAAIHVISPLTRESARKLLERTKAHLRESSRANQAALELMAQLHERGGALALGYENFLEMFKAEILPELEISMGHAYRLRHYVQTLPQIASHSPAGEQRPKPTLAAVRELSPVDREDIETVYTRAEIAARSEGKPQPQQKHTRAEVMRWKVENHTTIYELVVQWMNAGELEPEAAYKLVKALDDCVSSVQQDVMRLKVADPALVRKLNEKRSTETYREIVDSGGLYVGAEGDEIFVSVLELTTPILSDELARRAAEHRRKLLVSKAQPCSVVIYPGDPQATLNALREVMSNAALKRLKEVL